MFILKPSFAAGELSPALYGRTDLAKYDIGAAELENFLVLRYGGIERRPGTKYLATTKGNKPAVLIPFSYANNDSYVIEITAGCFRFYRNGALVEGLEVENNFYEDVLADIKYCQSADVLFLTHPNYWPMTLTRNSALDWSFEYMDLSARPFEDANVGDIKISASGVTGEVTLTTDADYFTDEMQWTWMRIGHTIKSQYVKMKPATDGAQEITSGEIYVPPQSTVYVETFGFWAGTIELQYFDSELNKFISIRSQNNNHNSNYTMQVVNESNKMRTYRIYSSDFDTTLWSNENSKQKGYVVLQCFAKHYYGMVNIKEVVGPREAVAIVMNDRLGSTEATSEFSMQSWSNSKGFPSCVGFYEDRLVFAGSRKYPQTYWLSKTGDYYNFGISSPLQDDDAITGTLNNGQMNGIKAMVPFGELILLTAGGAYKLSGGGNPLTPTNQQPKAQEYRGINNLTPVVCGGRIVFVQQMGSIVRDFAYAYEQDKYTGDDVSLLASHLFDGHTIVSIAYQQVPNSIVWCVRDDGVLLGMTYIKEQDVYAWHKHTTQGKFKNVCCIAGENEDIVYLVVERDGNYYVESMASQIGNDDAKEQSFVDCYAEARNTTAIQGLERFNGKEVQMLLDGSVMPSFEVQNGYVVAPFFFDRCIVGYKYISKMQTLPIEFNGQDGTFQSRKKRLSKMMIYLKNSRGGMFGMDENNLSEIKWRTNEAYGEAIKLYTGKQYVVPKSTWTDTLSLYVVQEEPLPMGILSIVPEIVAGG